MKDYYKICLEHTGNLIEKRVSESEAYCLLSSVYEYSEEESAGIFAVRKTKEEAINALEEALNKELADAEQRICIIKERIELLRRERIKLILKK